VVEPLPPNTRESAYNPHQAGTVHTYQNVVRCSRINTSTMAFIEKYKMATPTDIDRRLVASHSAAWNTHGRRTIWSKNQP
jgi:hypothetical protein